MISHIALALVVMLLDPPTPTPTPTATPGPGNSSVNSFYVDTRQKPPWDVPVFPSWGTGTPQSTVWAATPAHGTEYPGQVATATAQINTFLGPINAISTPISGVVEAGPTQVGGEISTGVDPLGTGAITFTALGESMSANIVDVIGTARAFLLAVIELGSYSPWILPIPIILMSSVVLSMFIPLIAMVIRAAWFLFNLLAKIATILSIVRWLKG